MAWNQRISARRRPEQPAVEHRGRLRARDSCRARLARAGFKFAWRSMTGPTTVRLAQELRAVQQTAWARSVHDKTVLWYHPVNANDPDAWEALHEDWDNEAAEWLCDVLQFACAHTSFDPGWDCVRTAAYCRQEDDGDG